MIELAYILGLGFAYICGMLDERWKHERDKNRGECQRIPHSQPCPFDNAGDLRDSTVSPGGKNNA